MGEEGDACQDGLMAGKSSIKMAISMGKSLENHGTCWEHMEKKKHVNGGFTGKIWENYLEMEMFHSQI